MSDTKKTEQKVVKDLRKEGLTVEAIAAVIANMRKESSMRPNLAEKRKVTALGMTSDEYFEKLKTGKYPVESFLTDRVGVGLCQWTAQSRKKGLWEFCLGRGKFITDRKSQVLYMLKELKGYKRVWRLMSNPFSSAYDIAYQMCYDFEAPAAKETSAPKRGELAEEICKELIKEFSDSIIF